MKRGSIVLFGLIALLDVINYCESTGVGLEILQSEITKMLSMAMFLGGTVFVLSKVIIHEKSSIK